MRERVDWMRLASMMICLWSAIGLFLLCKTCLWAVVAPFLLAWLVSLCVRPAARYLSASVGGKEKNWAILLLILFLFLFSAGIAFLSARLYREAQALLLRISENEDGIGALLGELGEQLDRFGSRFPFVNRLRGDDRLATLFHSVESGAKQAFCNAIADLTARLSDATFDFLGSVPSFVLSLTVFLFACFCFCADASIFGALSETFLPEKMQNRIKTVGAKVKKTLFCFVRANLVLMLLTFVELYIGLLLIGADYALLMAALIALVDLLPVFGTGTVMLPWAAICMLTRDFRMAIGLLLLYAVVTLIRRFAEPRIVGKSVGLHPLLSLFSMYAGFRLAGIGGMWAGPLLAILIRTWRQTKPQETISK